MVRDHATVIAGRKPLHQLHSVVLLILVFGKIENDTDAFRLPERIKAVSVERVDHAPARFGPDRRHIVQDTVKCHDADIQFPRQFSEINFVDPLSWFHTPPVF